MHLVGALTGAIGFLPVSFVFFACGLYVGVVLFFKPGGILTGPTAGPFGLYYGVTYGLIASPVLIRGTMAGPFGLI